MLATGNTTAVEGHLPFAGGLGSALYSTTETWHRIWTIADMCDLTLSSLATFHSLRYDAYHEMLRETKPKLKGTSDQQPRKKKKVLRLRHEHLSHEEMRTFLDAPDTEESHTAQSEQSSFMDCADFNLPDLPILPDDWLRLEELCVGETEVDCVHETSHDILSRLESNPDGGEQQLFLTPTLRGTTSMTIDTVFAGPNAFLTVVGSESFPVIFDSGASLAISGNREDFVGDLVTPKTDLRLGGMAQGMKIEGIGTLKWTFVSETGNDVTIRAQAYYVPAARARLISPQRLFRKEAGTGGQYIVGETCSTLMFDHHPAIRVSYDSQTHLPVGYGRNGSGPGTGHAPQVNLCITDDENQNLTPTQKLLLQWHYRFGHRNMPAVQKLLRVDPFGSEKLLSAARATIPRCEVCEFAKAHRQPTHGKTSKPNPDSDGKLKIDHLAPGAAVSVDHFESRLKGRIYTSFGKTTSDQYVGGCIFVDHASGYIHVEHQLGFSSSETIRAKQNYEQFAMGHGVIVTSYLADNGTFKANQFVSHLREHNQKVQYCGVNAHHQNGVAERSIATVSNMARAMLLHASTRWKTGIDSSLWPMAVHYATYIYNHLPNDHGIAPADVFTGSQIPRHKLRDLHVWGCPVFVLDPKLQQGQKLPRWEPRSRRGVFLGLSTTHSSDVPLVLNLQTGSISSQFHVVFDDLFSTVASIGADDEPPSFWEELCLTSTHQIPLDASDSPFLNNDWLSPTEIAEKQRILARTDRVRRTYHGPKPTTLGNPDLAPQPIVPGAAILIPAGTRPVTQEGESQGSSSQAPPPPADRQHVPTPPTAPTAPTQHPPTPLNEAGLRRSSRSTKGTFPSSKYIDEIYLSSVELGRDHQELQLAYLAELQTDFESGIINVNDPRAYAAKMRKNDPDNPSYHQAMNGADVDSYVEAMKKEITQLVKQNTWKIVKRDTIPLTPSGQKRTILKGTWAFKLKRLPDGSPHKFKARFCCRGDMQVEGVDYFETYAPVVQWSTLRILFTLILDKGWTTRQVDYTNAFAQAELNDEVYVEHPRDFAPKGRSKGETVLKLLKSLYGIKQAPRTFFEKLRAGLVERGFRQSEHDPCLFMKNDIICVVYVDDTILAGPIAADLEEEIRKLGVDESEHQHVFELRNEGEVGDFLGIIRIKQTGPKQFYLTQTGLIDKVLLAAGMNECRGTKTPTFSTSLGSDKEGEEFKEDWDYASVVGMLMYLASNSRPDIAFAVNSCARFTHSPRNSHAMAVKKILRYLNGTRDKGLFLNPTSALTVDCYVDADFAGLWGAEHDQDPVCVKSRTGYIIMFMGCPLVWASKLQTQIALSTMEAEYIALSTSMRELIGIRGVLKEMNEFVLGGKQGVVQYSTHSKAFTEVPQDHDAMKASTGIPQSTVHEDNEACLKFATMPKMSSRTKHIAVPYHFFRSKVAELEIRIVGIDTDKQLGDQFTKGLPEEKFVRDRINLMGW